MTTDKLLKHLLLLLPLLAACNETEQMNSALPIGFTTALNEVQTRYASDDLPASMGVFAYFTQGGNFNASASTPNFMHNQLVTNNSGTWSYTPVKYWPTNANDRVSFFAYAPHNASGLTACANTWKGYPSLTYAVPAAEGSQTDLLAATPLMNKTAGEVKFGLKHALTKVTLKVKSGDKYAKEITSLSINAGTSGELHFKDGGFEWTNVTGTHSYAPATTDLTFDATDTGRNVATFLLLPTPTVTATYSVSYKVKDTTGNEIITRTFTAQALPATPLWTPGAHISYTINLSEKTATVTTEITAWEKDENQSFNVKTFYENDLKTGDYFYDDGTWSDGGLRTHIIGTDQRTWVDPFPAPVLTNPETGNARSVIGIVFHTETSSKDKQRGWTNGYVVGLDWYQGSRKYDPYYGAWSQGETDTAIPNNGETGNGLDGYENCYTLMQSSQWDNPASIDVASFPAFYYTCVQHNSTVPPPSTSSTWYLPSFQQLNYLWNNLGEGKGNSGALTNIEKQIKKAGKTSLAYTKKGVHYSSDECNASQILAIGYWGGASTPWGSSKFPKKGAEGNIQTGVSIPVLAF